MAKASTRSSTLAAAPSSAFLLKAAPGGKKRVVVPRPKTYDDALNAAAKHFPSIPKDEIVLQSDELDILPGELVDISAEFWEQAVVKFDSVYVVRSETPDQPDSDDSSCASDDRTLKCAKRSPIRVLPLPSSLDITEKADSKEFRIISACFEGDTISCRISRRTRVATLINRIAQSFGLDPSAIVCVCDGMKITHCELISEVAWNEEDDYRVTIDVLLSQCGGKPVIYLFSPTGMDATVNLSLVPSWKFSAIYPVVPTKTSILGHESLSWQVRTHADGSLLEKTTGLDVAYLFWEAHTNADIPPSPPSSLLPGQDASFEHFYPNSSDLYDFNSVVLPVASLTPYLDKVLMALGLHTESRTSFITYWLPSFLKHTHIALRFVPQAAYEKAAPLDVSPSPDVVTRVFMLFKGVREENLEMWRQSQERVTEDVAMWRGIVGVDVVKASDAGLFRVLEWGGMEVLRG